MWTAARWIGWMRWPRRPFAGVAVAAIAGILLAEACAKLSLGWAIGSFLAAAAVFFLRPRTWLFWALVIGGFATLHLFALHDPPAEALAGEIEAAGGVNVPIEATGRVAEAPRPFAKTGVRFTLALESATVHGRHWECRALVAASWSDAGRVPSIGEQIEVTGAASNVPAARNPGEFDEASYLVRRGIRSEIRLSGIAEPKGQPVAPLAERVHAWAGATLRLDLQDDPEASALIPAVVLGLRDQPGLGGLEDLFQRTGTLHYFAIDGLKLGLLAWLVSAALAAAGLPRNGVRLAGLAMLLGYALAAGMGPSSLRAVLVAAAFLIGDWLDRPALPSNSLGAAAALILLADTNQLFTLGFQLSFAVVLAILVLTLPVRDWLLRFGAPDAFLPRALYSRALRWREAIRHGAADLVSVSLAAWVGSLPWSLCLFHLIAPVSILTNAAALPLVAAMFALGMCSLAGGWITSIWAIWMNNANWVLAKMLLALLRFCDSVPGGSFYVVSPADWRWPPPVAELTVLDLGFGRAAHWKAGGQDWLIDGGRPGDFARIVAPSLRWGGVNRLTGWIATEADSAHLGGAELVLGSLAPGEALISGWKGRSPAWRELQPHLASGGLQVIEPKYGADIAKFHVLFPPPGWQATDAADQALVFRLEVSGWRILWLGDAGVAARGWLAGHVAASELRCDALIAGAPESDPTLLQRIAPRLIIRERSAGRPPAGAVPTLRQEETGAVTLRCSPGSMEATGFVNGQTVRLAPAKR
jgi:ComEC/Rec2-related protein